MAWNRLLDVAATALIQTPRRMLEIVVGACVRNEEASEISRTTYIDIVSRIQEPPHWHIGRVAAPSLIGTMQTRYLDDAEEVAKLKATGFDGAIHCGFGENSPLPEYKVFDKGQVAPAGPWMKPEAAAKFAAEWEARYSCAAAAAARQYRSS